MIVTDYSTVAYNGAQKVYYSVVGKGLALRNDKGSVPRNGKGNVKNLIIVVLGIRHSDVDNYTRQIGGKDLHRKMHSIILGAKGTTVPFSCFTSHDLID